jgi:hypothetical protein
MAFADSILRLKLAMVSMFGPKQKAQGALYDKFSIEDHVPQDHPA